VRYRIEQACRIGFSQPVREHHLCVRLAPWEYEHQRVSALALQVDPEAVAAGRRDGFGNLRHRFEVLGAHRELNFRLVAEVETLLVNPFDFAPVDPARERAWIADSLHQAPRLWDFVLHRGALTPALPAELQGRRLPEWESGRPLLAEIQTAVDWVRETVEYDPDADPVAALPTLLEAGRGTAGDLAHLLIALLRGWGVPARLVSGYLDPAYFDPDDEAAEDEGPRPQTLHRWVEALIPGAGWLGFDPAQGLLADQTYIRVAVGRDGTDVEPLRRTAKGELEPPEIDETLSVVRRDAAEPV
jgi:transglutaminase-like putative cysteine protease